MEEGIEILLPFLYAPLIIRGFFFCFIGGNRKISIFIRRTNEMPEANSMKKTNLTKLVSMGMLCALAIAADLLLRLPDIGGFLTYEPKDVILTIGGFIFGPVAGILMSLLVCLIEMVTVSTTGFIGLLMNFLASAMFVGVSAVIYQRRMTLQRAVLGLIAGSFSMLGIMLLWNYIMTPIFMGVPREEVLKLFVPLLIPFNLIKALLNSALTLFLYKGVVTALRKTRLIPERASNDTGNKRSNTIMIICISALLAVTMTLVLLIFAGVFDPNEEPQQSTQPTASETVDAEAAMDKTTESETDLPENNDESQENNLA